MPHTDMRWTMSRRAGALSAALMKRPLTTDNTDITDEDHDQERLFLSVPIRAIRGSILSSGHKRPAPTIVPGRLVNVAAGFGIFVD